MPTPNLTIPDFIDHKPSFMVSEKDLLSLSDMKEGQTFRANLGYKVIEKTKSFVVLRINYIQLKTSRRVF